MVPAEYSPFLGQKVCWVVRVHNVGTDAGPWRPRTQRKVIDAFALRVDIDVAWLRFGEVCGKLAGGGRTTVLALRAPRDTGVDGLDGIHGRREKRQTKVNDAWRHARFEYDAFLPKYHA